MASPKKLTAKEASKEKAKVPAKSELKKQEKASDKNSKKQTTKTTSKKETFELERDLSLTAAQVDGVLSEEEEDALEEAKARGESSSAQAAAQASIEVNLNIKTFRHHPDMENFYRFIYENDLRLEALAIVDKMWNERNSKSPKNARK